MDESNAIPIVPAATDAASERSERFTPQKPLQTLDGGGIFISPSIVTYLTGNKLVALALWIFGGLYSFCSIYIYLGYGLAWPYNGGEFIYISKIFPVPPLLFACSFAWAFIAFATSTANAFTFARYIDPTKAEQEDVWRTRFIACVVVVGVSALHYRFVNIGILGNNLLAGFKIIFLTVLVIAGCAGTIRGGLNGDLPGLQDWTTFHGTPSVTNIALATLQVLFSYQGWENANYVTSEIKGDRENKKRILKAGALIAISIVVALYVSFNLFLFLIVDFDAITDAVTNGVGNITADYAIRAFGSKNTTMASHAIYISIALTAAGNLIGVTFTRARVHRDIARHRIIPFSGFFAKSSNYGTAQWDNLGTPTGGLILQALVTCITIAAVEPFRTVLTYSTYGHAVACLILGIGVLFIRKRMTQYGTQNADPYGVGYDPEWSYSIMKSPLIRYSAVVFWTLVNLCLIIIPFISTKNPDGSPRDTPAWVQPVAVTAVYVAGAGAALYIVGVVPGFRFQQSGDRSDPIRFLDYNDRRWIVRYPNYRKGGWWAGVVRLFTPLPWDEIWNRLNDNGEARTAEELRNRNR
ncbi:amino acid permease-domain-containing protein [Aspergillus californicus]